MTDTIERRYLPATVELRAADGGGPGTLVGYAAMYNKLSQNLGGFVERVAPAAFDKSLSDNVRALCRWNHADAHLLGTTDAGTLVLRSDGTGLGYAVDLPDTSSGRDCAVLAGRGDLRYSSFAFICIDDEWGVTDQGFPLRTLLQVQLVDVAPVNTPAYLDTTAAKRSLSEAVHLTADELADKPADEIRGLLLGDFPREETPKPEEDDEQRDTHSTPASIEALRFGLDALK